MKRLKEAEAFALLISYAVWAVESGREVSLGGGNGKVRGRGRKIALAI